MFHIQDDKRSRLSARLIFAGLVSLQIKVPYDQITVSTLSETAGVGRSTFYRLFDNKDDILLYRAMQLFIELRDNNAGTILSKHELGEEDFFLPFFQFWFSHRKFLKLLIECDKWAIFDEALYVFIEENLPFIKVIMSFNETEWLYFINLRVGLLSAALETAVRYNYAKMSEGHDYAEWLVQLLKRLSSRPLP